jgi:lipopolysaccharide/colanic/teichoic acid biosynthesis glycosyltransferase
MSLIFQTPNELPPIPAAKGRSRRNIVVHDHALPEIQFLDAIRQERRRSERSAKPFLLMLARPRQLPENGARSGTIRQLVSAVRSSVRETDSVGWYQQDDILGVIFTELGDAEKSLVLSSLKQRATNAVRNNSLDALAVTFTFHFFPEDSKPDGHSMDLNLYPELSRETWPKKFAQGIKRAIDLLGSAVALMFLFGILLAIALLIKLTSKGPVLFRQTRIGQHGKAFTFLKFRSMYVNNDASIHKDYVTRFIAGQAERNSTDGKPGVYKITNDPRVTPLGRFLRKTSLDELPQLLNVLKGEMSLVGPRPPVPYEFQHYDLWHRRRILEIKPGLTGLWQVNGRSRTSFDDMVRLDLQYAAQWSLWLDFKIFFLTPRAVLFGEGAY